MEVTLNGAWGTVNSDGFGMTDAHVVCSSLGFGSATEFVTPPVFAAGSGDILMDDVGCRGNEDSIFDCNYNRVPESTDTHNQDVGVRCNGEYEYKQEESLF